MRLNAGVMELKEVDFAAVLEESKNILKQCLNEYNLNEVFLSFNGGKDCTVLLDITVNIIREIYGNDNKVKELSVVYFRTDNPFPELEDFITEIEGFYNLNLSAASGKMKLALTSLIENNSNLKACLMGTRRTDPYSANLNFMQETDPGWPRIMRVSPLLDWSYHQIWAYLIINKIPYCTLYDKGYTSIGSTLNTLPNPSLSYCDEDGELKYRPAYLLKDGSLERNGRINGS